SWRRSVAIDHDKVGDVRLAVGKRQEALESFNRALGIREALVIADPDNHVWRRDLMASHTNIGDFYMACAQPADAFTQYRKAMDIANALSGSDPTNQRQHELWTATANVCRALQCTAANKEAFECAGECFRIAQALVAADSSNHQWQRDLAMNCMQLGELL